MDSKSLKTLEFDKVLAKLAGYTSFSAGRALALELIPSADYETVIRWQAETREAKTLLEGDNRVAIGGARDVRASAEHTRRGVILTVSALIEIKNTLIAARDLKRAILRQPERHPHLTVIAEQIEECPGLVNQISAVIDERGELLDTASPLLSQLRRKLQTVHDRIQEKLRSLINGSSAQYLQEPLISTRGGRYVIPLRADHKGRIKGIIHDQSASGATLWIEPLHTVDLNNEYRSVQLEEIKEVERILAELSEQVAVYATPIKRVVDAMAQFDLIFSRARYAMELDAVEPIFEPWRTLPPPHPGSTLWVRSARHPLLDANYVVPTQFLVEPEIFTVLITGPNTGGKTVALKNIGLMVLMAQSGMQLPASEARLTVFKHIFADIGDEQSIEQSLSTFSAHIKNIIRILEKVDDRSLVVLDELGSGTDPSEGAAIAQAILNYLRDQGATSFVATHYPELKLYATQKSGVTNASMMFNVETLSPTYEMAIGVPGKSNALAIARRLGLDETILDNALQLVSHDNREAESLIASIQDMRDRIANEAAATRIALQKAEHERDRLRVQMAGVEEERRRILRETRAKADEEIEALRQELRRVRQEMRSAVSQNALKKTTDEIAQIVEKIPVSAEIPSTLTENRERTKKLRVGDDVIIKTLNTRGKIASIQGNEAEIVVGRLHLRSRLDNLEFRAREEPETSAEKNRSVPKLPIATNVSLELDLRGMRVEEALASVESYLDTAYLAEMPWVRIIHGKGTGKLRQAVRRMLETHHAVKSWEEGREGEGAEGVTVAKFQ